VEFPEGELLRDEVPAGRFREHEHDPAVQFIQYGEDRDGPEVLHFVGVCYFCQQRDLVFGPQLAVLCVLALLLRLLVIQVRHDIAVEPPLLRRGRDTWQSLADHAPYRIRVTQQHVHVFPSFANQDDLVGDYRAGGLFADSADLVAVQHIGGGDRILHKPRAFAYPAIVERVTIFPVQHSRHKSLCQNLQYVFRQHVKHLRDDAVVRAGLVVLEEVDGFSE